MQPKDLADALDKLQARRASRKKWMRLQIVAFVVGGVVLVATGSAWAFAIPGLFAFGRLAYLIKESP